MACVKTNINNAKEEVLKEIRGCLKDPCYAKGLSHEGYAGGYLQALYDVGIVLNGIQPSTRGYWRNWIERR